jgi:hypothetical protein
MNIGGISLLLITGVINFILILFQVSSGKGWINVPFRLHRKAGIILLITAGVHAVLAVIAGA